MRILTLGFTREFNRKGKGWRLSHKENGSSVSSLICDLDETTRAYISNNFKLQERLDNGTMAISEIEAVPLYYNTLLTVKSTRSTFETLAVYIEAEEGRRLSDIVLKGCGALYTKMTPDKSRAAMIIVTTSNNWSVEMYQGNKKVSIDAYTNKIKNTTLPNPVMDKESIVIKRLIFLPKNVLFTRVDKTSGSKNIKKVENFISISIAQALSKNYQIIGTPKKVIFDSNLIEKDIEDLKFMLETQKTDCTKEIEFIDIETVKVISQ